ncbi:hypothetical protein CR513_19859, partial [Mucuna pruriens]
MHHCRPSKAIIAEGRFSRNFEFLTLYSNRLNPTSSHLSYSHPKLDQFPISRDRIAESKVCLLSESSSYEPLHAFDPEIERTLHYLRKARHIVTIDSNSSDSIWNSENSNFTTNESNFSEHQEAGSMENNDRRSWPHYRRGVSPVVHSMSTTRASSKSSQALKGVPCGLFQDEAVGDTGRPHKMKAFQFSLVGVAKD